MCGAVDEASVAIRKAAIVARMSNEARRMLLSTRNKTALLEEVFQAWHPVGKIAAGVAAAEPVPALLINVKLGGRSGFRQIHKQLRGANGVALVSGGSQQEHRREIFQRFTGLHSPGTVHQAQIIGP